MGRILSVNISEKKGEKKRDIGSCIAKIDLGLDNDAHFGSQHRQISLLSVESIDKIRQKGLTVHYGDFAENLTTQGILLYTLPVGTKLRIGQDVIVQVTQIGKSCSNPCAIFHAVGDCVMPREGIFVRVLSNGKIAVNDEIIILDND